MKKILVPTDFSKCAMNAVLFAFELAVEQKAEVLLYHSISPVYSVDTNFYAVNYMAEYYDYKKAELKKLLDKILHSQPAFKNIKIKTAYDFGPTAENIVDAAKHNKVDLIVMGTKGTSGIQEFIFGSTTGWVVAKSDTPVLVVPATAKYMHIKSPYLFATDFATMPDSASVKLLKDFCNKPKTIVKLAHVVDGKLNTVDEKSIKAMQKKLAQVASEVEFINDTDIPQAIDKYSRKIKAGMSIMVSHHYNMFERLLFDSVAKKATYHTKLPLLILIKDSK